MPAPTPPPTRTEAVRETLHGVEVADPYRWLEDATAADVRAWVAAQNAVTLPYLAQLPARTHFKERLERLWRVPRFGVPWRRGERWFQLCNDGNQDQDVLRSAVAEEDRRTLPAGEAWTPVVDPNAWSADGTASLQGLAITEAGGRMAVGRADAGSDWITWRVVDIAPDGSTTEHGDIVPWSKFSGAAWLPDGSGFFYGAYPAPSPGEEVTVRLRDQRLRLHRVGADPATDEVVYARPDQPEWGFSPSVSHDGRWLVLTISHGTHPENRVHVARIHDDGTIGEMVALLDAGDAHYEPLGVLRASVGHDELLLLTDREAPLGRIVAIGLPEGGQPPPPREVVAEQAQRLEGAHLVGGAGVQDPAWLVCRFLEHATSRMVVHDARDSRHLHDVALPDLVTVSGVSGGREDDSIHLGVESFAASMAIRHHDLRDGGASEVQAPAVPAPAVPIVTEQVRIRHAGLTEPATIAGDDAAIPLFLVHRSDVTPTGDVPTVLWGYGGYNIPVTPMFRPAWRAWVDAGGLLAVACLRGGGEYGREWHDAGRLHNRGNATTDALAVAAWLAGTRRDEVAARPGRAPEGQPPTDVDAVWTAPSHLGVEGRSNGGRLVASCIVTEPTRFGSAVPEVGVMDLLRFHLFTIGWAWKSDYGDPDDPDDFAGLRKLSPYHHLLDEAAAAAYPPTLITTGDADDRVVPAHSYKFAAALQAAQRGDAPVLLRVDVAAGHGIGKPVSKLLDERADVLAWHAHHLGLTLA